MRQYDIVLVGLDPTFGAKMQKTRPCVVISPEEMNDSLRTVMIAPLTTTLNPYPWRVPIQFQRKKGMVALDQVRTIDKRRIVKKFGQAKPSVVSAVQLVLEEMLVR